MICPITAVLFCVLLIYCEWKKDNAIFAIICEARVTGKHVSRLSEGGEGVTDALRPLQSKQNRLTYAGQNYIPRKDELSSPVYYYFTVSGNDFVVQQLIALFVKFQINVHLSVQFSKSSDTYYTNFSVCCD